MRFLPVLLALAPLPTAAWEFSPEPICTLRQTESVTDVTITYDPATPLYTLTVTMVGQTWADGPFTIDFAGGTPPQIGTTRQVLSDDRQTLTVTDRGFGNVLDGLETGVIAYMRVGATGRAVPLEGITEPLAAFRACPSDLPPVS